MGDVGDIAQVAAAGFTAGAAGAAWRSVDQGQRLWKHSIEPDLQVQVLFNTRTNTTEPVFGRQPIRSASPMRMASGPRT